MAFIYLLERSRAAVCSLQSPGPPGRPPVEITAATISQASPPSSNSGVCACSPSSTTRPTSSAVRSTPRGMDLVSRLLFSCSPARSAATCAPLPASPSGGFCLSWSCRVFRHESISSLVARRQRVDPFDRWFDPPSARRVFNFLCHTDR